MADDIEFQAKTDRELLIVTVLGVNQLKDEVGIMKDALSGIDSILGNQRNELSELLAVNEEVKRICPIRKGLKIPAEMIEIPKRVATQTALQSVVAGVTIAILFTLAWLLKQVGVPIPLP